MTVAISSLRVTADMDVAPYTRAMSEKVAADKRGADASKAVGVALAQVDAAAKDLEPVITRLSRAHIEGYSAAAKFEAEVRKVGRAMDTGGLSAERAGVMVEGLYRKFGLMSDAATLAEQGFVQVAAVTKSLNTTIAEQAAAADRARVADENLTAELLRIEAAERSLSAAIAQRAAQQREASAIAQAAQAKYNAAAGIQLGTSRNEYSASELTIFEQALADADRAAVEFTRDAQAMFNSLAGANFSRTLELDAERLKVFEQALKDAARAESEYTRQSQLAINKNAGIQLGQTSHYTQADADAFGALLDQREAKTAQAALSGVERELESLTREMDAARSRVDPLYVATKRYSEAVVEIERNAKAWGLTEAYKNQLLLQAETTFVQTTRSLKANTAEVGMNTHQWKNLGFQINDVVTMALSGSGAMQILATQGGQILQVLQEGRGGIGGSLKTIGTSVMSAITPVRLLGGAFAAMGVGAAVALYQWGKAQEQLDRSLQGLGRTTNASVADLEAAAESASKLSGVTTAEARTMVAALASTGKIGVETYTDITSAAQKYADVTGKTLTEVTAEFAASLADPAKAAAELDKKLNVLTADQYRQIMSLASHGRQQEAVNVLIQAMNRTLPDASRNLNLVGQAFRYIADSADDAWTAVQRMLGSITRAPAPAASKALQDDLADRLRERLKNDQNLSAAERSMLEDQLRQREERSGKLREQENQDRAAKDRAKAEQDVKGGDAAVRASDPGYAEIDAVNTEISALEKAIVAKKKLAETTPQTSLEEMFKDSTTAADDYAEALSGAKNKLDGLVGSDGKMRTYAEQLARIREKELLAVTAVTEADRNRARIDAETLKAQLAGAGEKELVAKREDATIRANTELQAQAAQAQRERVRAGEEAIQQAQLEAQTIGMTAGEQATANANLRTRIELAREFATTGIPVNKQYLAELLKQNEALGKQIDLNNQARLRSEMGFELRQLGRTDMEQRVASSLRQYGLGEDLTGINAGIIRMTLNMQDFHSTTKEALSGFANDLINGTKAADALSNMLKRLSAQFADRAIDAGLSALFGGSKNSSGGGLLGGILGLFGGGGSSSSTAWAGANVTGLPLGFSSGGDTGRGADNQVAGYVHANEFVFSAPATRALGVANLDRMHRRALRGYNSGGLVTAAPSAGLVGASGAGAPSVTLATSIDARGSSMSEEQMHRILDQRDKQLLRKVPAIATNSLVTAKRANMQGVR